MKLNLGSGDLPLDGYENLDAKFGDEVFPIRKNRAGSTMYADNFFDEIRASHVLEHFPHGQTLDVLREWMRVLKPGGWLKIAVPDVAWISAQMTYGNPGQYPLEAYLMGGQIDGYDFHKSAWRRETLESALHLAGLIDIQPWTSEIQDCASLPVSLNLMGQKPELVTVTQVDQGIKCKHGNPWYSSFGLHAHCCMCCGVQMAQQASPGYCIKCLYEEVEANLDDSRILTREKFDEIKTGIIKKPSITHTQVFVAGECKHGKERCAIFSANPYDTCACCGSQNIAVTDGRDHCNYCWECRPDAKQVLPKTANSPITRTQVFAAGRWQDLSGEVQCATQEEVDAANAGQLQTRTIVLGEKRAARVALCMSTPRIGFLRPLERLLAIMHNVGVSVFTGDGVFWHHALSRSIKNACEFYFETDGEGFDFILTGDYDSYVQPEDIKAIVELLGRSPEADCIVPLQMKRGGTGEILAGGENMNLTQSLMPIKTGHFGFTLFRKEFFEKLPRPWFYEKPDADGHWGEGRVDADIGMWLNAQKAKLNVMLAPGIVIGHGEELVVYPRIVNGKPEKIYQAVNDWLSATTKPEGIGVQ